jgi:hypothetical protein
MMTSTRKKSVTGIGLFWALLVRFEKEKKGLIANQQNVAVGCAVQ